MDSDTRHYEALAKRVASILRGQDVYVAGKVDFNNNWAVYLRTEPEGEENELIAEVPDDWVADEQWGRIVNPLDGLPGARTLHPQ